MDDKQIDLVSGGFDVAIRAGILPDFNLIARQLTPLHSVICASPSYIEKMALLACHTTLNTIIVCYTVIQVS
jgi:DNA-binding transcriptional LysR family regulator